MSCSKASNVPLVVHRTCRCQLYWHIFSTSFDSHLNYCISAMSEFAFPPLKHNYFHIYAYDVPNAQREKHMPRHLEQNNPLVESGLLRAAGGLLQEDSKSTDAGAAQKIVGSFVVVREESIDKVWDYLKNDIFYTSGEVWDHEKIVVKPVLLATPDVKFD
ncbi:hypothetical protein BD413DRAFT_577054 [Trametes elegans]|nr:hypothetical protein BD413DRAFT_577054 [Trametes elegans]